VFSGAKVTFHCAKFSGSQVWFNGAVFSGGMVNFPVLLGRLRQGQAAECVGCVDMHLDNEHHVGAIERSQQTIGLDRYLGDKPVVVQEAMEGLLVIFWSPCCGNVLVMQRAC